MSLERVTGGIPYGHLNDPMAPLCGGIFTSRMFHPKEVGGPNGIKTPDFCCFELNYAGDIKHIDLEGLSSNQITRQKLSRKLREAINHTVEKLGPESLQRIRMTDPRKIAIVVLGIADYRGNAQSLIEIFDSIMANRRFRTKFKVDAIVIWFDSTSPVDSILYEEDDDRDEDMFHPGYIVYTHNSELTDGLFRYKHQVRRY